MVGFAVVFLFGFGCLLWFFGVFFLVFLLFGFVFFFVNTVKLDALKSAQGFARKE